MVLSLSLCSVDVEHSHVRFLGNLVLNLWDCGGWVEMYNSFFPPYSLPTSLFLCVSLSLSLCVSFPSYLPPSLSPSLCHTHSSLSPSPSLPLYLSMWLPPSLLAFFHSLLPLSLASSHSLLFWLYSPLSLYLTLSPSLPLPLSLHHSLTLPRRQEIFMENYFTTQRDNVFRNVEVLIYVFDVESREVEKDMHYYQSCLEAILQVQQLTTIVHLYLCTLPVTSAKMLNLVSS